ncbi:acyltransferase family protein [Burkholderia sp. 22PA0106]|uniref:acyltransferase family protein n=1 Tax=Burkholderia sp. 22PA0106 TaxID=3237371 RepID=UPI0039C0682C
MNVGSRHAAPESAHSFALKYRPDIDGLRAVAVTLVVLFHAFPSALKGGFAGVDIFFVISGFLIGNIILSELAAGSFSLAGFYARRVKRIFPALLLVLIGCFAFGWFELLADDFKLLGAQIAGGAAFVSNFVLWHQAGYFDTLSEKKPLLHLWSLAIEEQFYLVWPLILMLIHRLRRSAGQAIAAVWVLSFGYNVLTVQHDDVAAFYSPLSRFWELMTGCALAWLTADGQGRLTRSNELASWSGAALIGAAVLLLDDAKPFPGWWALLPTLGAALVIAGGPSTVLNRGLSRRAVVWVGLISYPLYLWHWPLLAFARIMAAGVPSWPLRAGMVVLAVVLAALTTFAIERPIRRMKLRGAWHVLVLCVLIAGIGVAGYLAYKRDGMGFRMSTMANRFTSTDFDMKTAWREHSCFLEGDDKSVFPAACDGHGKGPLVVLWGDSFAAALYPGLVDLQRHYRYQLAQYTASGCPPLLPGDADHARCAEVHKLSIEAIRRGKPDLVILDANWTASDLLKIPATVTVLRAAGVRHIVLVGSVPHWQDSLPNVYWAYWRANGHAILPARSKFALQPNFDIVNAQVRAVAAETGVGFADSFDAMCNERGCDTRVGEGKGEISAFDTGHLTLGGAVMMINAVAGQLLIPSIAATITPGGAQSSRG